MINSCTQCQSIDPAAQNWDKGHLSVIDNWQRLAVDVTHYNRVCYLTCVDCGPSRYALRMINGTKALGLQIRENKLGQLMWSRGNDLPI